MTEQYHAPDPGERRGRFTPDGSAYRMWEVRDAGGNLVAYHHRRDLPDGGKELWWRGPRGEKRLRHAGLTVADLPVYNSESAGEWPPDAPVVLVEGEVAADALEAVGIPAVGTVTGAGATPGAGALEVLRGRVVVLWRDNDVPGRVHMHRVAGRLQGIASEVRIYEWPDAPEGGDAADHPAVRSGEREAVAELLMSAGPAPTLNARQPASTSTTATSFVDVYRDDPILSGERNIALARICGWLHDGHRDLHTLTVDLLEINASQCRPPMPEAEARDIAAKMFQRPPCKPAATATDEVHRRLDAYERAVRSHPWRGKAGYSDRDVLLALVHHGRQFGRAIPVGVRVEMSRRDLALAANVALQTTSKAITRLKLGGWLRLDNNGRRRDHAGAFVLCGISAQLVHLSPQLGEGIGVLDSRVSAGRWGHGGKKGVAAVETLARMGGAATVQELARALGDRRPWELKRRQLVPLQEAGVVSLDGQMVVLAAGWQDALRAERELCGESGSVRADRRRFEDQRERFHDGGRWHE